MDKHEFTSNSARKRLSNFPEMSKHFFTEKIVQNVKLKKTFIDCDQNCEGNPTISSSNIERYDPNFLLNALIFKFRSIVRNANSNSGNMWYFLSV